MQCPLCLHAYSDHCTTCGYRHSNSPIAEIDVHRAHDAIIHGAVVLDVRTPEERQEAFLPGSMLIPLYELGLRYHELPSGKLIITQCHHGIRSLVAAEFLLQKGFNAQSMRGGIDAWSLEVDQTVARY